MIVRPNLSSRLLARGWISGAVMVSRISDSEICWFVENAHQDKITAMAWSADDGYLATSGSDNMIRVWDATNGNCLCSYHQESVHLAKMGEEWKINREY